jgi:hypothetical protein
MSNRIANETGPLTDQIRVVVKCYLMYICLIVGLTGNIITLIVLTKKRMRTQSTNVYLMFVTIFDSLYLISAFVVNLAYNYPQIIIEDFYQISLLIIYPLIDFSSNTSIYVILVFTVERYLSIKHPFRATIDQKLAKSKLKCYTVILITLVLTLPTILENKIVQKMDTFTNKTQYVLVKSDFYTYHYTFVYFLITAFLFHIIPFIILIILNTILIKYCFLTPEELMRDSTRHVSKMLNSIELKPLAGKQLSSSTTRDTTREVPLLAKHRLSIGLRLNAKISPLVKRNNEKKRLIILLVAINIVLVLCQLPSSLVMIREAFVPFETLSDKNQIDFVLTANNIANGLQAINASLNFFLYCGFSKKFRASCGDLLYSLIFVDRKQRLRRF